MLTRAVLLAAATAAAAGAEPAGTVTGVVRWSGPRPEVRPFVFPSYTPAAGFSWQNRANPHAPAADAGTGGLAGAVVTLRGVDPARAKAWDHPPVSVELADRDVRVRQGDFAGLTGFVRTGDAVTLVSRDRAFHSLSLRGADFFTAALPDPDRPRQRRLTRPGVVELSSAAGYFWARGWLFVADHPYFARTDARGRFTLTGVPPGPVEVSVWVPNWNPRSVERNPESTLVFRQTYAAPALYRRAVTVAAGAEATADFEVRLTDFERAGVAESALTTSVAVLGGKNGE